MNTATEYHPATGKLGGVWMFSNPDNFAHNETEDKKFFPGEYDLRTQYVKEEKIADRPVFTVTLSSTSVSADGSSALTLSGFPENSTLTIAGPVFDTWTETGTTVDLTVNIPGRYQVKIECWPYQDQVVTFDAT